MLQENQLEEIERWNKDHFGDNICEWTREVSSSTLDRPVEKFALTIQQQSEDKYTVAIEVAFEDTSVGDLLGAEYSDSFTTVTKAMSAGRDFVSDVENNYITE